MNEEKKTNSITERLCKDGWKAYITGGAARNIINGERPNDYDIVTNAPYEVITALFAKRKMSLVGASFKVCIIDGIEVATYRKDKYFSTPGSVPSIVEAKTIQEDLARRDLTINSMAFCPYNGDIVDEYGGVEDLKNRIIRFTGNPVERIMEDPCRILRACRFLAKLEGNFNPATFEALKKNSFLVKERVAPERIRLEILKTMRYHKPSMFFDALHEIGALKHLSPGFELCYNHDGGGYHGETIDEHIKMVGDTLSKRKPLLRLAGFWHDHGKPAAAEYRNGNVSFILHAVLGTEIAEQELMKLKFSVRETEYVKSIVRHHMRNLHPEDKPKTVRKMLKKLNDDGVYWKDWLQIKIADTKGNLKKKNLSRDEIRRIVFKIRNELKPVSKRAVLSIKDLAVNGEDVMRTLNIKAGPKVGKVLNKLLDQVLDNPSLNKRKKLIKLIP